MQEKRMEIMKGLHEAIDLREVPRRDLTMLWVWLLDIRKGGGADGELQQRWG